MQFFVPPQLVVCSTFTEDIVCPAASGCCWGKAFAGAPGHKGTCGECVPSYCVWTPAMSPTVGRTGALDLFFPRKQIISIPERKMYVPTLL